MNGAEWAAVVVATLLTSVPVGVLLTWSVWARGAGRSGRFVPALLTLHAGAATVIGVIGAAAAVRSWQLVERDQQEAAAATLLDVSRIDGDRALYALLVLFIVAATGLLALLLSQATRLASSDDAGARSVACSVIGLEIGVAGLGVAQLATGDRSAWVLVAVAHLPVLIAAMVVCWPPHPHAAGPGH